MFIFSKTIFELVKTRAALMWLFFVDNVFALLSLHITILHICYTHVKDPHYEKSCSSLSYLSFIFITILILTLLF